MKTFLFNVVGKIQCETEVEVEAETKELAEAEMSRMIADREIIISNDIEVFDEIIVETVKRIK